MKDLKNAVGGQKTTVMSVFSDVHKLIGREKQSTDPTTQQLVKKLHRSASDTQIRYSRVKHFVFSYILSVILVRQVCCVYDSV